MGRKYPHSSYNRPFPELRKVFTGADRGKLPNLRGGVGAEATADARAENLGSGTAAAGFDRTVGILPGRL